MIIKICSWTHCNTKWRIL